MFGLIFWSSLWVILFCVWFPMKNETKFKKNIVLGVTLPKCAREDPQIVSVLEEFRKRLNRICLLLAVLSIAGVWIRDLAVSLICWSVMLVAVIAVPMAVYALENRKLRNLKAAKGWKMEGKQQIRVDLETIVEYPKPKTAGYVLCALLCVIPMLFQHRLWWAHLISLVLVVLCNILAVQCYRRRSETVDGDAVRTRMLSLLRYKKWKQIWLLAAGYSVGVSYALWAVECSPTVSFILILVLSLLFGAAVMAMEMQTRKLQEKLTEESGTQWYADEDDFWLGGLFYYNPHDSHLMVNTRVGVGSTVNLATAGGKILSILTALLLVSCLVFLCAAGLEDKAEISLGQSEQFLFCENGTSRYEVPMEQITEIELADSLPAGMWRVVGTAGQHLIKGRFSASGFPDLRVLADPTMPPYVILRTASGPDYLFGSRDPRQAIAVFTELSEDLGQ